MVLRLKRTIMAALVVGCLGVLLASGDTFAQDRILPDEYQTRERYEEEEEREETVILLPLESMSAGVAAQMFGGQIMAPETQMHGPGMTGMSRGATGYGRQDTRQPQTGRRGMQSRGVDQRGIGHQPTRPGTDRRVPDDRSMDHRDTHRQPAQRPVNPRTPPVR